MENKKYLLMLNAAGVNGMFVIVALKIACSGCVAKVKTRRRRRFVNK